MKKIFRFFRDPTPEEVAQGASMWPAPLRYFASALAVLAVTALAGAFALLEWGVIPIHQ